MQAILSDNSTVTCSDTPFAEGADGILFASTDGQHVVKLYKHPEPWRIHATEAILNRYNAVREHQYWEHLFAWPNGLVVQPSLGIRMRRISGQRPLSSFVNYKFRMARLSEQERGTWRGYAETAAKVARLMRRLHNLGLCHSDLSENNIFLNPSTSDVTLLDCDGLVVPQFLPPAVVGTKGYMAPEIWARNASPSIQTDLHALAVIIYRMLLIRDPLFGPKVHDPDATTDDLMLYGEQALFIEHPDDHSNRPRGLKPTIASTGPELERLFLQAFVSGLHYPERRPSAAHWERGLVRTLDRLIPCSNPRCEFKVFAVLDAWPRCSWCGTALSTFTTLPLLHLYKRVGKDWSRDGSYMIVGLPDRTLHWWHVDPAVLPGPAVDAAPLGHFEYQSATQRWFLLNNRLTTLRVFGSNGVSLPAGDQRRIELTDGLRILFGDPEQSRVALVQLLRRS